MSSVLNFDVNTLSNMCVHFMILGDSIFCQDNNFSATSRMYLFTFIKNVILSFFSLHSTYLT